MRVLFMGLSGSGKTTLANAVADHLRKLRIPCTVLNADQLRAVTSDYDFSQDGRLRQAARMRLAADDAYSEVVILDFIAALESQREIVDADFIVWLDTVKSSSYADTDAAFERPEHVNMAVSSHSAGVTQNVTNEIIGRLHDGPVGI